MLYWSIKSTQKSFDWLWLFLNRKLWSQNTSGKQDPYFWRIYIIPNNRILYERGILLFPEIFLFFPVILSTNFLVIQKVAVKEERETHSCSPIIVMGLKPEISVPEVGGQSAKFLVLYLTFYKFVTVTFLISENMVR